MPTFEIFNMPDAGEGLTEADIVTWRVKVGDVVEINQPLVEIETAKSLVELPCPWEGVVHEILVPEGENVEVGTPIIVIDINPGGEPAGDAPVVGADAGASSTTSPVESEVPPVAATASAPVAGAPEVPATPTTTTAPAEEESSGAVLVGYGVSAGKASRSPRRDGYVQPVGGAEDFDAPPVVAKPPVRALARELGIELTTISPSGPGGMVTREDVIAYSESQKASRLANYPTDDDSPWLVAGTSTPDGRATRVPVRSVRKRTAEAMVRSAFSAPHVTVFHTVDVTATMELVAKLKADREFQDVRVTPLLIVAKALLMATRRHPEINASWDDDAQEIVYKHYVNLGIAASTPRGLVVPNIKDAHRLSLHQLAEEIQQLTQEARSGKTPPRALSDGTITITNVGALGIDTGTPILNPGEAGILAFGTIRQMPWVHNGEIQIRWVTQLALSFDHRLVDGELGSRVLADVAKVMNDPAQGLIWG